MYIICSNGGAMVSIARVNDSTDIITYDTETAKNTENTDDSSNLLIPSKDNADIENESAPLMSDQDHVDHTSYEESIAVVEEHITFADIPMPGLWEGDKPGRNTDRIIILLFILLASMIVVSILNFVLV